MKRAEVDVLVVGAGPVGLMASLLLARRGMRSLVVERRDGPHRAPQAHVINPRTLEICRMAGMDMDALRAAATPREDGSRVRFMTTLAGEELGSLEYERQGDENLEYTPTPLLNLPQHLFEPILLGNVHAEALARVEYHRQWQALEQDDEGVTSLIENLEDGTTHEVRSRYVLAADGAGSRVRKSLGIEMDGPAEIQSFQMVHLRAALRDLVGDRPAIIYWILEPSATGTFVAHDIDGTWVFMRPYDSSTESAENLDEEACAAVVRRAIGAHADFEIRDIGTWTMTAQVAQRYRVGRVFLVGDSAHRFPPAGGMGMNTGIQDAHNLVWKLAAVDSWNAPPTLLDTYQAERQPIAHSNSEQSLTNVVNLLEVFEALGLDADEEASKVRMTDRLADPESRARVETAIENQRDHFDMLGLQLGFHYETGALTPDGTPAPVAINPVGDFVPSSRPGSRVPHAWVRAEGRRVSLLDLIAYDAFTLITGSDGDAWRAAADGLAATRLGSHVRCLTSGRELEDPEGHWAAVSGIANDGALLVRPDQHVAWRSRSMAADPAAELECAIAHGLMRTHRALSHDRHAPRAGR